MKVSHNPSVIFSEALGTAVGTAATPSVNPLKVVNGNSKLTYDEVLMLKLYYYLERMTSTELAKRFNISNTSVNMILKKKSYKNVVLNYMTKIPEQFHVETGGRWRTYKITGHK